jgi:hypothetical protein
MSKIKGKVLADLLSTHAGNKALRDSVGEKVIRTFAKKVSEDIISAQKYYVGNPDGKFITLKDFDDATVNAGKAYETINTLMGNDNAELMRFDEGKKQTPGLISAVGLNRIADMLVLLFVFANDGEEITYDTVRACRQTEISETKDGEYDFIDALQSSTKATVQEIVDLGYGNKNKLAICKFHFHKGAVVLDMIRFGKDYLKPEEKEVLLLTGNKYKAKCLGYSDEFFGKDGKPALMYDVDVYEPDDFKTHIDVPLDEVKKFLFDPKMIEQVRDFYEKLNSNIGGEYPEEPESYREWKNAFKMYVYSQLDEVYKSSIWHD